MRRNASTNLRILLTDTTCWPVVPRLVMRFQKLGAKVAVLCPTPGHLVRSLRQPVPIYSYNGFHPLSSLRTAIESFDPAMVVPACDRSVQHLHQLHANCLAEGGDALSISRLIGQSLGSSESYHVVSSRYALLRVAQQEGIRAPQLSAIDEVSDLDRLSANIPPPWVIKADGTWGGRGVRIVHNVAEAKKCFRELRDRPGALELAKRMLLNRDRDWIYLDWSGSRPAVIAQEFIAGRPANCAVVCHEGELLAGITVEVIQSEGATGPATVVQVVPGAEMLEAATRIARRLRLSGFFGLDFVIEESTGATYLVEMNPRCTPPCPLPLGKGRDPVSAFWFHLREQPVPHTVSVTRKSQIAYFPQAVNGAQGEPNPILSSSFVDKPEEEPALVQHLLHPKPSRSLLGQTIDRIKACLNHEAPSKLVLFEDAIAPSVVSTDLDEPAVPIAHN